MSVRRCVKRFFKIHLALMGALCLSVTGHPTDPAFSSPSVKVNKIHFQSINAETRLIFGLNTPVRDLKVTDLPGRPMTLTFTAAIPAKTVPINKKFSLPNLNSVYVEHTKGRMQVFIKRNVVGTVNIKQEKNRLVVSIPHYYYRVNPYRDVASGVRHTQFIQQNSLGPSRVNVLEVDPNHPEVEVMPALASRQMGDKSNVATMVSNHQAVAGINGSFFKPDVGIPLGILMINQELISGPIYDRVALGITPTNQIVIDNVRLGGEVVLPDGRMVRVHNINQPRVKPNTTVVYSSRWGAIAPKVPGHGMQIQLINNRVTAVSTSKPLSIPRDGFVISGPKTPEMVALSMLSPQRAARLNVYTLPDWSAMKHAIGGGPWLVKNGQPYVDLAAQHFTSKSLGFREPRSAVGVTRDGKLLLVTVDGRRQNVSVGMTLYELAYLMKELGAVSAMNLDGGSSTQMSIYGKMVNQPSSGNVGVSNSLIVRRSDGSNMAIKPPVSQHR